MFACGAWLAKLFPDCLGDRIFPTRQTVFYFGIPAGDGRFSSPALPTWLIKNDECYGMPDLESRGLKIALDQHGERIDVRPIRDGDEFDLGGFVPVRFRMPAKAF